MTGEYGYHSDPRIDAGIAAARRTHPYYASALDGLRIVRDDRVATMSTSRAWVTHYNSATVAGWTADEVGAVLVHEVEHLLRRHFERCGDRDPGQWNIAGDAEINQRLDGLPSGCVYPETLPVPMPRGATAETYYGAATAAPKDDPQSGDGSPTDADGDGAGQGGAGEPSDAPGQGAPGAGTPGADAPGTSQCGSAAGGPTQPHEMGDAANPGPGAENGGRDVEKRTAERVMSAPGDTAGDELRAWAESVLRIDRAAWYRALSTVIGRTLAPYGAHTRYQWPGRRDHRDLGGAVLPRWTGERPSCAVVLDTSSSITPADLDLARAAGLFLGRAADVTYYGCNTVPLQYGRTLPESIRGGGGTNMRAGIDRAIADGHRAVVVITDCETDWDKGHAPTDVPSIPVIIGVNVAGEKYANGDGERIHPGQPWAKRPPKWATVVRVVRS